MSKLEDKDHHLQALGRATESLKAAGIFAADMVGYLADFVAKIEAAEAKWETLGPQVQEQTRIASEKVRSAHADADRKVAEAEARVAKRIEELETSRKLAQEVSREELARMAEETAKRTTELRQVQGQLQQAQAARDRLLKALAPGG